MHALIKIFAVWCPQLMDKIKRNESLVNLALQNLLQLLGLIIHFLICLCYKFSAAKLF